MHLLRRLTLALVLSALATAALAHGIAGLEVRARDLSRVYADLISAADACPGGTCADADTIRVRSALAEDARQTLHEDRDALGPCDECTLLDQLLQGIDTQAGELGLTLDGWDDQS